MKCFFKIHAAVNHVKQLCRRQTTVEAQLQLQLLEVRDPLGSLPVKVHGSFLYFGKGSPSFAQWANAIKQKAESDSDHESCGEDHSDMSDNKVNPGGVNCSLQELDTATTPSAEVENCSDRDTEERIRSSPPMLQSEERARLSLIHI